MVSVLEPDPATDGGAKLAVTPNGRPDTEKLIVPLNPLVPAAVTV